MASWDDYFMTIVYLAAARSKDPNTHIGAVIVGPDNEIRSTGYNGLPRSVIDGLPERDKAPEKYSWYEHAERNSIYNAARVGIPLKGCRMYTNGLPCADCARAVIQVGITEIIVDDAWGMSGPQWAESLKCSATMFDEAGIKVRSWIGELLKIQKIRGGKIVE